MKFDFESLERKFSSRKLLKGDVLFREGDTNGDGFIILYGQIEIFRDVNDYAVRAAVLGEGEVLGVWKALFNNPSRFFTAKALTNSSVVVIPESHLTQMFQKADPFFLHCMKKWLEVTRDYMKIS